MPISNSPTTLKLLTRGSVPAGVTVPCGVMATTGSPMVTPSARASSTPSTMPNSPGLRSVSLPRFMCAPMSATVSSSTGSTPRINAPRLTLPAASIACPNTNGAAAFTRGSCRASAATRCQLASCGTPRISMCDATDRMRLRSSSWNPFITDSTTISAATPSAMPAIDVSAMNEMNELRPEPLRARV